ncbi:ethanolamine ammonia-lyase reactivating factor EutA [Aromatoleum toluclasticum]|uniref:ethanolamine ammonia-lyase reactivating factor EutA n=1 Tax=Aromatoleum toluclasticum TaxID=92003 RepID=UPI00037D905F|nr:ethanolamine ammonia-lyase reactivating factor EutA [Aromatoleum toluclasticum]
MSDEERDARWTHRLADHLYGEDFDHHHDEGGDHDHDHDHLGADGLDAHDAMWQQDHVALVSVGIDIGSSGTQVIFSRIALRRLAEELSSRYVVVARDALYQSPITLTPYQSAERIDEAALGAIIDEAYAAARLHPDDVDTGVVILTGEALRRDNAEAIAGVLAETGGEFVCATAGHHMEAKLAAYGSGAVAASRDGARRILNVDIGGGTTKLALVDSGRILATAALHIGGRLQVVDEAQRILRLDPAGERLAVEAGYAWQLGARAERSDMSRVAESMACIVLDSIVGPPSPGYVERFYLTERLPDLGALDGVMFSGGVGEYVYRRERRDFGDMGLLLGAALRHRLDTGAVPWPLLPPGECIRATALGASEYTVQLSGNTLYISDPRELLPRRNLQVLQPACDFGDAIDPERVAREIRAHFAAFDLEEGEREVALALRWRGAPSYARVSALAAGIVRGLANTVARRLPIYLILDGDVAQTLGALLRDELSVASEVLAIDGVVLWDFDYIDLGRIRMPSQTVPVTIKSLVFNEAPQAATRPHRHPHRHPYRPRG